MYIDKQKSIMWALILFIMLYAGLTFGVEPDTDTLERYQLTPGGLRILLLSIALPLVVIWYAAFYGFAKFKAYSALIKQSPEGRAYRQLANGLMVLAIGLPLTSVVSAGLRNVTRSTPDITAAATITENYLGVVIALVAFTLIGRGARLLLALHHKKPTIPSKALAITGVLLVGGLFAYLALKNPAAQAPTATSEEAIYYLPDWLIVATIILPHLYVWYNGLTAAYYIKLYRTHVKGVLYKQSLRFLAWGIAAVIISSMLLQYFTAMSNVLMNLNLGPLLGIIYVLLIVISAGYILIAIGAKRLQKLEEV